MCDFNNKEDDNDNKTKSFGPLHVYDLCLLCETAADDQIIRAQSPGPENIGALQLYSQLKGYLQYIWAVSGFSQNRGVCLWNVPCATPKKSLISIKCQEVKEYLLPNIPFNISGLHCMHHHHVIWCVTEQRYTYYTLYIYRAVM